MLARLFVPAMRCTRQVSTSRVAPRMSDQFVMQLRLPGRTTGSLSTGVVPYANDPMVPSCKYFKPRGLDSVHGLRFMLQNEHNYRVSTKGFTLVASPWNEDEHPRDHNGLRIRDYRVACMATKKGYSKKAYHRWRAMRLLRTAASLILPDKGLKRCDYLLIARAPMRFMDRDGLFLDVEHAIVTAETRTKAMWARNGRRQRLRVPDDLIGKEVQQHRAARSKQKEAGTQQRPKILRTTAAEATTGHERPHPQQCVRAAIQEEPPNVRQQEAHDAAKPRRDSHQSSADIDVRSRMESLELSVGANTTPYYEDGGRQHL
ncbi:hypothetical protein GGI20_001842 [Coemansia sp. BCRC 34301]|nr:hypothetical protein GGI20_001842 [Coemansia sp. BCRC 34301]